MVGKGLTWTAMVGKGLTWTVIVGKGLNELKDLTLEPLWTV